MRDPLAVSVVIVSRDRCILGVSQLYYPRFEVVVVADHASCTALRGLPQAAHVKIVEFGEANISAARNAGIANAAGDIIAFIDDDAVPEPTWLDYLRQRNRSTQSERALHQRAMDEKNRLHAQKALLEFLLVRR